MRGVSLAELPASNGIHYSVSDIAAWSAVEIAHNMYCLYFVMYLSKWHHSDDIIYLFSVFVEECNVDLLQTFFLVY